MIFVMSRYFSLRYHETELIIFYVYGSVRMAFYFIFCYVDNIFQTEFCCHDLVNIVSCLFWLFNLVRYIS